MANMIDFEKLKSVIVIIIQNPFILVNACICIPPKMDEIIIFKRKHLIYLTQEILTSQHNNIIQTL